MPIVYRTYHPPGNQLTRRRCKIRRVIANAETTIVAIVTVALEFCAWFGSTAPQTKTHRNHERRSNQNLQTGRHGSGSIVCGSKQAVVWQGSSCSSLKSCGAVRQLQAPPVTTNHVLG